MIRTVLVSVGLSVLASTLALCAYADDKAAASADKEKQWKGTVLTIDDKEKTLKVKGPLWPRTFNLAENCAFTIGEKDAALDDVRAGQKVRVTYKDASGVFVANRVVQEKLVYTGTVQGIDTKARTLTLKKTGVTKRFHIAGDCKVVLKDDRQGALDKIKTGQRVTVVYEVPSNLAVAREIEQKGTTSVGTLSAIDASNKSVRTKHLMGDKKFNLADDCQIVVNGKNNGQLSDLRIGQKVTLTYDEVDGVNVLTHIAAVTEPQMTETARATK